MPKNFVATAIEYAKEAARPECNSVGKLIKLAAQRFLNDLERAKDGTRFTFDSEHANSACAFIEKLPHPHGDWETPTIVLCPAHVFFLVQLFGFRKLDGSRRFTSALLSAARKNGNSVILVAIALYVYCCEQHPEPEVITASTTHDQASIAFSIARSMVSKSPELREEFDLRIFAKSITCAKNGGSFKAVGAKASLCDGLNPSVVIFSEVSAYKNHDLISTLKTASCARKSPFMGYETAESWVNRGPWSELRQFSYSVLNGTIEADHFLGLHFAIDDGDDEFDESCWAKANPLLGVNPILLIDMRLNAIEAKQMPGRLAEFRAKRLNLAGS